ncbi:hypothetical protein [Streptomyces sp. NPDC048242]|uniref:hypothetical protein n=1 Tax=Streptomyces sp. NPDC048242 TaxID=3155026 RepID=UPI0034364469
MNLDDASLRATDFTGCHIPQLSANRSHIDGDLTLTRLVSDGISLFGARVSGNLWLTSSRITRNDSGFAVSGPQLRIGGGLYAHSAHMTGGVNLWGAEVFTVEVDQARLAGRQGPAFRGDGLRIVQDLRCTNLLIEDGGIRLFGAKIGGQFWLVNADVRNSSGWSISAPKLIVDGGIYAHGLTTEGGVNLFAATIGESIELTASTLLPYRQHALRAPGARVEANITLDDATHVAGDITLTRLESKGTLSFSNTAFSETSKVNLNGATLGTFRMESLTSPPVALDLSHAKIGIITHSRDSWPSHMALTALTYQALDPVLPADHRLAWLRRGSDYHPQPYEQLAAHYRQMGHDDDARKVLLAQHRLRRRGQRAPARLWGYVEDATVGYGYRPGRALIWLLALTTAAAIVFAVTPPWPTQSNGPAFQPFIFALDLILPILDLGQEKAFAPVGSTTWIAWFTALSGWLLSTAVITSVTRRLSRSA